MNSYVTKHPCYCTNKVAYVKCSRWLDVWLLALMLLRKADEKTLLLL